MPMAALEYLTFAEEQLERVSHIAKQTLAFYRESRNGRPVDMAQLVESALKLYSNKLNTKQITVEKNYENVDRSRLARRVEASNCQPDLQCRRRHRMLAER